ncbi:MAG TPA: ATP-binding protein, partial [Candidatus Alectryocaccobium stercorigallinarum]|nr:ATP-binding protein [Candidatus Alectryocaccobium stercorigallinarum]
DDENKNIIFGECKYWKGPVGLNVLEALKKKAENVDWNKEERMEYFVLFSINGFTPELAETAKTEKNILLFS